MSASMTALSTPIAVLQALEDTLVNARRAKASVLVAEHALIEAQRLLSEKINQVDLLNDQEARVLEAGNKLSMNTDSLLEAATARVDSLVALGIVDIASVDTSAEPLAPIKRKRRTKAEMEAARQAEKPSNGEAEDVVGGSPDNVSAEGASLEFAETSTLEEGPASPSEADGPTQADDMAQEVQDVGAGQETTAEGVGGGDDVTGGDNGEEETCETMTNMASSGNSGDMQPEMVQVTAGAEEPAPVRRAFTIRR